MARLQTQQQQLADKFEVVHANQNEDDESSKSKHKDDDEVKEIEQPEESEVQEVTREEI